MPCSEKGKLTDEDFFFYRKKAGNFFPQTGHCWETPEPPPLHVLG
jgi:hypothetical protein